MDPRLKMFSTPIDHRAGIILGGYLQSTIFLMPTITCLFQAQRPQVST
jgi:hypothetical protein